MCREPWVKKVGEWASPRSGTSRASCRFTLDPALLNGGCHAISFDSACQHLNYLFLKIFPRTESMASFRAGKWSLLV